MVLTERVRKYGNECGGEGGTSVTGGHAVEGKSGVSMSLIIPRAVVSRRDGSRCSIICSYIRKRPSDSELTIPDIP